MKKDLLESISPTQAFGLQLWARSNKPSVKKSVNFPLPLKVKGGKNFPSTNTNPQPPQNGEKRSHTMFRLSPKCDYPAIVKSLKTNESKSVIWNGARLDWYLRHPDFLVTITSNIPSKPATTVTVQPKPATEKFAEQETATA